MSSTSPTPSTSASAPESTQSCVDAVPDSNGYVPPGSCNSYYNFYPSLEGNLLFAVLFLITFVTHIIQMLVYRKKFCWVVAMGALWELAAFVMRSAGAKMQQNIHFSIWGTLLLLLAPLWINAFVYMTLARLIHFLLPEQSVWKLKATAMTKIFVGLDIVSFIVQAIGGSMLSGGGPDVDVKIITIGQQIYTTGVAVQGLFIVIFAGIAYTFHSRVRALAQEGVIDKIRGVNRISWTLYAVLGLIFIRIIYRIAEFAKGLNAENQLITHEVYPFVLDAVPMFAALLLLNIFHPGMVLRGPGSEFMSRKEKKAAKEERKTAKKEEKAAKKSAKLAQHHVVATEVGEHSA